MSRVVVDIIAFMSKRLSFDSDDLEKVKEAEGAALAAVMEEPELRARPGDVRLEPVYESPWSWPFTSPKVMVDEAPPGWPFGLCPLCNNKSHAYLDACIMTGKIGTLHVSGFRDKDIARHLMHHIGPLYREVFSSLMGDLSEADLPDDAATVYKRVLGVEKKMREDEEACPVYTEGREEMKPGRINATYAWDGCRKVANPHPWSIERTKQEMDDRKHEAINFYDAMVDIDDKAKTIYNEGIAIGGSKGLAVAVKALHERRGAMTDLAKVGLIAKSVSDRNKTNELSPGLQSMLDTLFAGEPERLAAMRDVTPPALPEDTQEPDQGPSLAAGEEHKTEGEDDERGAGFGNDDDEEDDFDFDGDDETDY